MRSFAISAESGPVDPTSRPRSDGRSAWSWSIETSSARLPRRHESIAALRAIS
jgi:hypothetical protein